MISNAEIKNFYPLSNSQMNIWNLEQSFRGTPINNICETIRIKGVLDIALLQQSLNLIIKTDSTLRTQVELNEHNIPVQYEQEYLPCQFPVFDFSGTNQTGFQHWENSITREVMNVINSPLYYFAIIKIGEHDSCVFVKTHHLISDGWSQVALINRIAKMYLSLLNKENFEVEFLPSYKLHIENEQKYYSTKAYEKDKKFWNENLLNIPQPVSLKEVSSAEISPVGQRKTFYLSETLNHSLNLFCITHSVAPFAVFYMAMAIYLKRIRGADKICIGAPIHNRSNLTDRLTTGMFVSTLPFLSDLDESWSFEEFNNHLAEKWLDLLRHQKLPFTEISEIAKKANPDINRLFNLVLSFHNSQAYRNRDTLVTFSGQWHYSGYQAEHICVHINNFEDEHRFSVNYDYLTQLFSKYEIEDFHNYIVNILTQALAFPQMPISDLEILSDEEREKVVYSFNKTEKFIYDGNLEQKLNDVCCEYPLRVAVIQNGNRYTYKSLWESSEKIAKAITQKTNGENKIVAVLLPKSYELFLSIMAIVRSGNGWVILSPELPVNRIKQILSNSNPSVVISNDSLIEKFKDEISPNLFLNINNTDNISTVSLPTASPDDLAYLVYTSGSTGTPKGVEIEQHSLLNFADAMKRFYGKGAVLSLCNIGFDAFVLESVVSLINAQTIVLPTEDEEENPSKLASLINNYAVGFMALTPSRLQAYLNNQEFLKASNRLETIICGGEAFPASLLKNLSRATSADIYNQYGPSETTIGVSCARLNNAPLISVGSPMQNCRLYILDKNLKPLPIGVFGDLYIGGKCVGRGYHNLPQLTEKAFLPNPFETGERIYRTGDIASYTENGEIVLKGREDGQVKLRGQRIELDEISSCLMMHPSITQAVVRMMDIDEQIMLVAYYVPQTDISECELLEFSATYLPTYMIPSVFEAVKAIPLTSNGKVDFSKLPIPNVKKSDTLCENISENAKTITQIFQKVLNRADIIATDDYFMFGGDSLNAMETLAQIELTFNIRLRIADLYVSRCALSLEKRLFDNISQENHTSFKINKAPIKESYPLTPSQLGIYFESQMSPNSTAYNMPCSFKVNGIIDEQKLQNALLNLIKSEEIFHTVFVPSQNGICQKIINEFSSHIEIFKNVDLETAKKEFVRPFNLATFPLLRVGLWKNDNNCVIMFDMHHIISDGVTASMVLNKLSKLYCGEKTNNSNITFLDYAYWFKENEEQLIQKENDFWTAATENLPSIPEIPTDFPRQKQFNYIGKNIEFALDEEESQLCNDYCKQNAITPFMLFSAAFGIFLSKLTGSKEMMVGTPISLRRSEELADTAGLLINTLPLRLEPNGKSEVCEYISQVKDNVINLIDNCYMPLEKIVSLTGKKRAQNQNPLYNTIVSMRPSVLDGFTFGNYNVTPENLSSRSAKVDLNFEIYSYQNCYNVRLEYAQNLFDESTILLYSRSFKTILSKMISNDKTLIEDIDATSDYDRYYLIDRPHTLHMPFSHMPIDSQIDAMAKINPNGKALVFHNKVTTFSEIKTLSDNLAAYLISEGVKKGDNIGLICVRGEQLIIGMLAVLKTGAAYVPMLPKFPEKRLKYMSEISGVTMTLCDSKTMQALPKGLNCKFIDIGEKSKEKRTFTPVLNRTSDDVSFVLFTSGSTGNPKGVMIRHRSVCNLMAVLYPKLIEAEGGYLCAANSIFDIFTTETLIAMAFGKYSVMADEEEMLLPWKTADLIKKHNVKLIEFTASRAKLFLENKDFCNALKEMPVAMMCGEVLPPQLLQKLRDVGCKRIFNLYGPTETTVYSTMDDVTHVKKITVGKMYPNCRGYILDEDMRPVMPTANGELFFAGECLAAGYVGAKELTAQAFLPDPFYAGDVMYKSGDIVRMLADGRIDFIGRRDHQVKFNGQRIELAEITQKILDSSMAAQAATVVKQEGEFMILCSFAEPEKGKTINIKELKKYMEKELPPYMVPSKIIVLPQLPCTASGKVDLVALKNYDINSLEKSDTFEAKVKTKMNEISSNEKQPPKTVETVVSEKANIQEKSQENITLTENISKAKIIENIWQETLSINKIEPNISFFEQGGTSLAALSLLSSYYNMGISMTLSEFYEKPTLNEQLKFLGEDEITIDEKTECSKETMIANNSVKAEINPVEENTANSQNDEYNKNCIEKLWQETLSINKIEPNISFFEQGGTSLAALSLLSSYYNMGISMTLSEFYEKPTLNEQLEFLGIKEEVLEQPLTEENRKLQERALALFGKTNEAKNTKTVLLTGATGFFGAHLLKTLLDFGYEKVYCLVRGENPMRLNETLSWYFGNGWAAANNGKFEAVCGDVTKPNFGLNTEVFEKISSQISFLVHSAADVRHYACDNSAEITNTKGAENAVAFAEKANAKLIHISTVSLSGEYLINHPEKTRTFAEYDFEIGQNWNDSLYLRGKYEAEKRVHQAMSNGMSACIFRIGRLVGRSTDGVFQRNAQSNAFWGLVNGITCLDMISKDLADLPLEMTAVDDCAKAVVSLMNENNCVYHIFNPKIMTVREILTSVNKTLPESDRATFENHLKEKTKQGYGIRLAPLISQYQRLIQCPFRITPICENTQNDLLKHNFIWQKPNPSILLRLFLL